MEENREIPSWLHEIVVKFKQSQLSLTVDDLGQLNLSESFKGLIIEIIQLAQKENNQPPAPQLLQELQKLGVKEIEEISTVADVVLSAQKQKSTIQYIQNQFVFPPPIVTAPKKTFAHTFGLPEEFVNFTGRKEPLEQLDQSLSRNQLRSQPRVIISGTGGIGKTQLAVTAAYQQMKYYQESKGKTGCQSVIWFIAGTDEGVDIQGLMTEQFHRLGQQLGLDPKQLTLKDLVEMVYQQLREKHGPFLVVFDNTQNLRQISSFLPPSNAPIIITTRNNNNRDFDSSFKSISLAIFTEEEALTYIQKFLATNHPELYQENEAKLLAKSLGYFPLALTQALAYINAENITIQNYLGEFTQQKAQYLQERLPMGDPYQEEKNPRQEKYTQLPTEPYDPQKATVWAVIQLSLKKVMQADANQILKACSYLAPEAAIDLNLLAKWTPTAKDCREAVAALRLYSLLENTSTANHVRIHQLVQEILRASDNEEAQEIFLACAAEFIGQHFEKMENPLIDETRNKLLFPHLQSLLTQIEKCCETDQSLQETKAALCYYLGNVYGVYMSDPKEAAQCLQQSLNIYIRTQNATKIAQTMQNLGATHLELGDESQAKALLEIALPLMECVYGSDHSNVALTLTNLGMVARALGDAKGAKDYYERALAIEERIYGPKHHTVAKTSMSLANIVRDLGDPKRAKAIMERVLTIQESIYGSEHAVVALTMINLATIIEDLGEISAAKALLGRAQAINERTYGLDHPIVANSLICLGNVTHTLGDAQSAKALYLRALAIKERTFGIQHPEVATPLAALANTLRTLGDPAGAKLQFERALSIIESTRGSTHPELAKILINYGNTLRALGDSAVAKLQFERALSITERNYAPEHPMAATALSNLGNTLIKLGDLAKAQGYLERALAIRERIFDRDHPEIATILYSMGLILVGRKQPTAALEIFQHCYRTYLKHFGEHHPLSLQAQEMIRTLQANPSVSLGVPGSSLDSPSENHPLISSINQILKDPSLLTPQKLLQLAQNCFDTDLIAETQILAEWILAQEPSGTGLLLRAKCQLSFHQFDACRETLSLCQGFADDDASLAEMTLLSDKIGEVQTQTNKQEEKLIALRSKAALTLNDQLEIVFLLRTLKQYNKALEMITMIISKKPPRDLFALTYFHQALCLFKLKRYQESLESWEECEKLIEIEKAPNVKELGKKIRLNLEFLQKFLELLSQLQSQSRTTPTLQFN